MTGKAQPTPRVAEAAQQTVDEVLTPAQVADMFKIETGTVYEITRSRCKNPLPSHKVGKVLRFKLSEVREWFDKRRKAS